MDSFVIERIIQFSEEFLVGVAAIQRGIMLASHVVDRRYVELTGNVLELRHPAAALFDIIGSVGQIAGEHDEVRFLIQAIDCRHRFLERPFGVRVYLRAVEANVGIR